MNYNSLVKLESFAKFVNKIINESVSDGKIKLNISKYIKVKGHEIKEGSIGTSQEMFMKNSLVESVPTLLNNIKNSSEYQAVLNHFTEIFNEEKQKIDPFLESFIIKLISQYERTLNSSELEDIKNIINIFLQELNGSPVKFGIKAKIKGITFNTKEIVVNLNIRINKLDIKIKLRKLTAKDIENEFPAPVSYIGYNETIARITAQSQVPTILEVETSANLITTNHNEAIGSMINIMKLVIIALRLFRTGGIEYLSYDFFTDSVINWNLNYHMKDRINDAILPIFYSMPHGDNYLINDKDIEKLSRFWEKIKGPILKNIIVPINNMNHIAVAYKFYINALLTRSLDSFMEVNVNGKIAFAIMGLEALFLEDSAELKYRLGLRISKLLGIYDRDTYSSIKVNENIKTAYNIRSKFLHGTSAGNGNENSNLLSLVMDYLRNSIIIYLLIHKSKNDFIKLIDNSLINPDSEKELKSCMNDIINEEIHDAEISNDIINGGFAILFNKYYW